MQDISSADNLAGEAHAREVKFDGLLNLTGSCHAGSKVASGALVAYKAKAKNTKKSGNSQAIC